MRKFFNFGLRWKVRASVVYGRDSSWTSHLLFWSWVDDRETICCVGRRVWWVRIPVRISLRRFHRLRRKCRFGTKSLPTTPSCPSRRSCCGTSWGWVKPGCLTTFQMKNQDYLYKMVLGREQDILSFVRPSACRSIRSTYDLEAENYYVITTLHICIRWCVRLSFIS